MTGNGRSVGPRGAHWGEFASQPDLQSRSMLRILGEWHLVMVCRMAVATHPPTKIPNCDFVIATMYHFWVVDASLSCSLGLFKHSRPHMASIVIPFDRSLVHYACFVGSWPGIVRLALSILRNVGYAPRQHPVRTYSFILA